MENRFDTLAKLLAGGLSRREALRCIGGMVGGTLLACLGTGTKASANGGGNNNCDNRCKALQRQLKDKGFNFQRCVQECHKCHQPEDVCETSPTKFFCCNNNTVCCDGRHCTDRQSDNNNCGQCGNRCPPQHVCRNGKCVAVNTCPQAGVCGGVPSCGNNCNCIRTTEETIQCVRDNSCFSARQCNSSRDCLGTDVCVSSNSSCCPKNVCASLCT